MADTDFFRALRATETVELRLGYSRVTRTLETIPGYLAREHVLPMSSSDLRHEAVQLLQTALTPKDWLEATELCHDLEDIEAVEFALGKLATMQSCTWWCCLHAMLRKQFLDESGSEIQVSFIEGAVAQAGIAGEFLRCAEAIVYTDAALHLLEPVCNEARMRIRDFEMDRIVVEEHVARIMSRQWRVSPFTIFLREYPFIGPAIT